MTRFEVKGDRTCFGFGEPDRQGWPSAIGLYQSTVVRAAHTRATSGEAVSRATWVTFGAGREFTTADILEALRRQVPPSLSQREASELLRN